MTAPMEVDTEKAAIHRSAYYGNLWLEIEHLMSTAGYTPPQISEILPKIKSKDVLSMNTIEWCDILVILRNANIEETEVVSQLGKKIVALLNDVDSLYCVVQLERVSVFSSRAKANNFIKKLKKKREDNYYDGCFHLVTDNISIFRYEQPKCASEAQVADFLIHVNEVELHDLFEQPLVDEIVIDVRIKCVTQTVFEGTKRESMKIGIKRGIERVGEEPELGITKTKILKILTDVMREVDDGTGVNDDGTGVVAPNDGVVAPNDDVVACENAKVQIANDDFQLLTSPNEDSINNTILNQIAHYAVCRDYRVSTNKSTSPDIPHVVNYSKYATSRPDLSIIKGGHGLFVICKDDDGLHTMEAMAMAEELKKSSNNKKDPIGQLMGNMNKLEGDIIYRAVHSFDMIPTKFVLFGLFVEAMDDQCTVYKAIFQPNIPTKLLMCSTPLTISKAVNGVFSEMSYFYKKE